MSGPRPAVLVDIDSTLYDADPVYLHWLERLFGVRLEKQALLDYNFYRGHVTDEQFGEVIRRLHADAQILANAPYPGAVETLQDWAREGIAIHIVSDRRPATGPATRAWLAQHAIPSDAIVLEHRIDKLSYCQAHGIGTVVDDKPGFLEAAAGAGLVAATIIHRYDEPLLARDARIIGASSWAGLRARLDPLLGVARAA